MDSRVAVVHPTTFWRKQQYLLGEVRVEGIPEAGFEAEVWSNAARIVAEESHLLLGTPDLEVDHPVLSGIRHKIEQRIPARPFSVRTELLSEHPKRFVLVIKDIAGEVAACPPEATP